MNKLLSIFLLMVIFISFNVKGMEGDGSEKEDFLEGEENLTQLCLEKDITGTPAGCIVNCFPVMEKSCFLPGWKKALGGSEFQQIFNEERRCFASQFLGFDRYFRNQQKRRPLIVLVIGESGFSPSGRPKMRFHCPTTKTRYLFLDPCICEGRFIVENMPENAWGIKGFVSDLEKFPFLEGQIDYFIDDINLLCGGNRFHDFVVDSDLQSPAQNIFFLRKYLSPNGVISTCSSALLHFTASDIRELQETYDIGYLKGHDGVAKPVSGYDPYKPIPWPPNCKNLWNPPQISYNTSELRCALADILKYLAVFEPSMGILKGITLHLKTIQSKLKEECENPEVLAELSGLVNLGNLPGSSMEGKLYLVLEKCEALKDAYYGTLDAEENLESCEFVLQTLMLQQSDLDSLMAMAAHIKRGITIPKILEEHGFRLDGSLFFKKKFPISPAIEPQEEL